MPRVTEEYRRYMRRRILEEATKKFSEKGAQKTSMNDIAEALGVSKPVIYQHFSGKEELLEEVIKVGFESYYRDILAELRRADIDILTSGAFYDVMWETVIWSPLLASEIFMSLYDKPEINQVIQGAYIRGVEELAEILEGHKETGEISGSIDTELLAISVFGLMDGIGMQEFYGLDHEKAKAAWTQSISATLGSATTQ